MFKNLMRFFSPKYFAKLSRDCHATFVRVECREPVAAKFWRIYSAKFSRHSYKCRVVRRSRDSLEKTCEHLATIWRENKTKRHSYECRATLSRMSRDCRTNENENEVHTRENRETLSRMSRDCRTTVARLSRDSREIYFQN